MSQIGDANSVADGEGYRDHNENQYEVFRLDQKGKRNHHDFVFPKN